GIVAPLPSTPRCMYSAGVYAPLETVATMHHPPACMLLNSNLPLPSVDAVRTSGGFVNVLQSVRRSSPDAPAMGCPEPMTTTLPESDAVPGGNGGRCCGGACAASMPRRARIRAIESLNFMKVVWTVAKLAAGSKETGERHWTIVFKHTDTEQPDGRRPYPVARCPLV